MNSIPYFRLKDEFVDTFDALFAGNEISGNKLDKLCGTLLITHWLFMRG
jgi:hypothetical protein